MGSNTVKFLAAEISSSGVVRILAQPSVSTRLGEGMGRGVSLSNAAMKRTLDAVHGFQRLGIRLRVKEWIAVATSAVRDSSNGDVFTRRFRARMGFDLRVLDGRTEAELIFRGATSDPHLAGPRARLLVMDSGGGSAEWICGARGAISHRVSLPLGCVRMTRRFLRGDPYTKESFQRLIRHYETRLEPLRRRFTASQGRVMIGTGGSICTAAALDLGLRVFQERLVHGHRITRRRLEGLLASLRSMTQCERLSQRGLPPRRADVIVAGLALFVTAMRRLGAMRVVCSYQGLRFGILEVLKREQVCEWFANKRRGPKKVNNRGLKQRKGQNN